MGFCVRIHIVFIFKRSGRTPDSGRDRPLSVGPQEDIMQVTNIRDSAPKQRLHVADESEPVPTNSSGPLMQHLVFLHITAWKPGRSAGSDKRLFSATITIREASVQTQSLLQSRESSRLLPIRFRLGYRPPLSFKGTCEVGKQFYSCASI